MDVSAAGCPCCWTPGKANAKAAPWSTCEEDLFFNLGTFVVSADENPDLSCCPSYKQCLLTPCSLCSALLFECHCKQESFGSLFKWNWQCAKIQKLKPECSSMISSLTRTEMELGVVITCYLTNAMLFKITLITTMQRHHQESVPSSMLSAYISGAAVGSSAGSGGRHACDKCYADFRKSLTLYTEQLRIEFSANISRLLEVDSQASAVE